MCLEIELLSHNLLVEERLLLALVRLNEIEVLALCCLKLIPEIVCLVDFTRPYRERNSCSLPPKTELFELLSCLKVCKWLFAILL